MKRDAGLDRKKSLRRRYLSRLMLYFVAVIIVLIGHYVYVERAEKEILQERQKAENQFFAIEELNTTFTDLILQGRSYLAFEREKDLKVLYKRLDQFEETLDTYRAFDLSRDQLFFVDELEQFYHNYRYQMLPEALVFMQENKISAKKYNNNPQETERILFKIREERINQSDEINHLSRELLKRSGSYTLWSSGLYGALILSLMVMVRAMINRIIRPIEILEDATYRMAQGEVISLPVRNENDEIDHLMNSFAKMAKTIQLNEEELVVHNEQLRAQQEELEDQQGKIHQSLKEKEKANFMLERLNQLNHRLTYTLDKQQLIDSFHTFLKEMYPFDRSMLWLTAEKVYHANGLSKETIYRMLFGYADYDKSRLLKEKTYFIKREVDVTDYGISEEPFYAYDLYSPVFNAEHEIIAIFASTRVGYTFTEDELEELNGLMQRLGLSIGRIQMYEQVEMAHQLNQDIVQNINEGIQFINCKGEMLQFNDMLRDDILGADWKHGELIPFEEWTVAFQAGCKSKKQLVEFFSKAISIEQDEVMAIQYESKNGRFIDMYLTPVARSNEQIGFVLVHRDITREHEIDQMKSELVSTVSHELRTPLSSILGFTELLLTRDLGVERHQKYLQTIHKEAKRLTNLINDFLDIQRMESGRQTYNMIPCSISNIAFETVESFKHKNNHRIHVENKVPNHIKVCGDVERLQQVFTNLVGNAVKFSPNGGEVEIKLTLWEHHLITTIRDEGLGIAQEDIGHLFKKFRRVDHGDRRTIGGTGLGLSISKEIIEHHNGEIWIESEAQQGTTVTFTLPIMERQLQLPAVSNLASSGVSDKIVLIVEDDESTAMLLSDELRRKGFSVIHHRDSEHALADAKTIPFIGIVVNPMLNNQDKGWTFIKQIRDDEVTKDIPIIISSALDEDTERLQKYKVKYYLTKPYEPKVLANILQAIVRSS